MNDKDIKNRVKQFIDRLCHADKCNILAGNQEFVNYVFKNLHYDLKILERKCANDDEYIIFEIENTNINIAFYGWYSSYEGYNYSSWSFVYPQEVTIIKWCKEQTNEFI